MFLNVFYLQINVFIIYDFLTKIMREKLLTFSFSVTSIFALQTSNLLP